MKNKRLKRVLGVVLFAVGVVIGLGLAAIAATGDMEAMLFDAGLAHLRDEALPTLRCPVFITASETGTVRARFKNPTDSDFEFRIFAHVSQYLTMWREEITMLPVAAGESEQLEWAVTADDAVQGNLVLAKILRTRHYPLPAQLGSCGIFVLNLPFGSGRAILTIAIVVMILCLAGGTALTTTTSGPVTDLRDDLTRAMLVLSATILAGLLISFLGGWALGILFVVFNLLLVGAIAGQAVNRRR